MGTFRVARPDGSEIVVRSRKGRALFALLTLNQGIAVPRSELASQLWPERPAGNQLQSLRQTVKELHAAFAPDAGIDATRDTCRLALPTWNCDAVDALQQGSEQTETLLPEMTEAIFDRWRAEISSLSPSGEWAHAARNAATLMHWVRAREPARVLDLLYTLRELIPYMTLPELEAALRGALEPEPDHPHAVWANIQLALVLMWQGKGTEGIAHAKSALLKTDPNVEPTDWASAVFAAALFLLLRGRFGKAHGLLTSAIEVARATGSRLAVDRLRHALAHGYAYRGDLTTALQILDSLDDDVVAPDVAALRNAHRSVYSLLNGELEEAKRHFFRAQNLKGEDPDMRLTSQIMIAESYVLRAEGFEDEAKARLLELHQLMSEYGIPLVAIHTLEGLALVAKTDAERDRYFQMAMTLRAEHSLPLLPLDRLRLGSLVAS
jgi:hypothetical protein